MLLIDVTLESGSFPVTLQAVLSLSTLQDPEAQKLGQLNQKPLDEQAIRSRCFFTLMTKLTRAGGRAEAAMGGARSQGQPGYPQDPSILGFLGV